MRKNKIQAGNGEEDDSFGVQPKSSNKLKKEFPIMYKLHEEGRTLSWGIAYAIGLFLILFLILITFKANSKPWTWPQWVNAVYLSISRPLFIIGVYIFALAMFVGRL